MNLNTARNSMYYLWGACFLILIGMFEIAPSIRRNVINPNDAHGALIKVFALYVPILASFMTFWFRGGTRTNQRRVPVHKVRPAFISTLAYQGILILLFWQAIYGSEFSTPSPTTTFNEHVSNALQIGLILSPIATAPAAYFLGVDSIDVTIADRKLP